MSFIKKKLNIIELRPAHLMIVGFATLILVGTFLLMLPISTEEGHRLNFIDALFEATSAVCVTGLAVVDTGTTFTLFGEIVLMVLVQLGGLGITTAGIFTFVLLGKKIGLKERLILQETLNQFALEGVVKLLIRIMMITFVFEIIGAIILTIRWLAEMPWNQAIYYGIFHSIMAFNNAGFGLEPDNLMKWVGDPTINLTITLLFIIGGIGFTVIMDIYTKRSFRRLSLHSKLTLLITLIINVIATVLIFVAEYKNPATLGGLSIFDQMWAAYFQGVVPRTAGFNTIDITQMTVPSQALTMGLMFVGSSPASTGGGIKVTTFLVILLSLWAVLRNKEHVTILKRRISWELVNRAFAIAISAIIFIFTIFFILTFTEKADMGLILFETVSAFGTVGLTAGLTFDLSPIGRVLIVILMFIGRIGPLTMALALLRKRGESKIKYVEEKILIG